MTALYSSSTFAGVGLLNMSMTKRCWVVTLHNFPDKENWQGKKWKRNGLKTKLQNHRLYFANYYFDYAVISIHRNNTVGNDQSPITSAHALVDAVHLSYCVCLHYRFDSTLKQRIVYDIVPSSSELDTPQRTSHCIDSGWTGLKREG